MLLLLLTKDVWIFQNNSKCRQIIVRCDRCKYSARNKTDTETATYIGNVRNNSVFLCIEINRKICAVFCGLVHWMEWMCCAYIIYIYNMYRSVPIVISLCVFIFKFFCLWVICARARSPMSWKQWDTINNNLKIMSESEISVCLMAGTRTEHKNPHAHGKCVGAERGTVPDE